MFSLILFIIALLIAAFGAVFLFATICHYVEIDVKDTFIADCIKNYLDKNHVVERK